MKAFCYYYVSFYYAFIFEATSKKAADTSVDALFNRICN